MDVAIANRCLERKTPGCGNAASLPELANHIRAELSASNTCAALGIVARGSAPALVLCRQLLAAGVDPDRAMEIFRGATLALRVRSISEAAEMEINSKGSGFLKYRDSVRRASPVRSLRKNGGGGHAC